MAGKPAVQVKGAREFRAAMKRMGADLSDLTAINRRAADRVGDASRPHTPVLSGALVGTVRAGATRTRGYVRAGSSSVPWAGPIHFGWPARNIKEQPFLYEGLDDSQDAVEDFYEQHIEALVEKVARETPP